MNKNILPLVVEAEELETVLNNKDLVIIDLSRDQVYQQAHIPGALFLDFKTLVCGEQPASGKIPSADNLSKLFSELGITKGSHIVAYDDEGGGWAGRLIWTLDVIGHFQYSYLNGGIHAWIAAGLAVEQEASVATPSDYKVEIGTTGRAEKDFILDNLGNENFAIWDARSKEEYDGTRSFAARAGHIPGAVNYEWTKGMDKENFLKIRDLDAIKEELSELGIDSDKNIVTHCQTHHRSGFTYLLGKVLGFPNIRAYDGSWSEWGNDDTTPIESNQ